MYSTKRDRDSFNSWFYKKVDKRQNPEKSRPVEQQYLSPIFCDLFNEASSADSSDMKTSSELQNKQDCKVKQDEFDKVTNLCSVQANTDQNKQDDLGMVTDVCSSSLVTRATDVGREIRHIATLGLVVKTCWLGQSGIIF